MHEIYHSGYCHNNVCYFRNWSKVPAQLFDNMIKAGATDEDLRLAREEGAFYENKRTPETNHFVMHGSSVAGVVTLLEKTNQNIKDTYNKNQLRFLGLKIMINQIVSMIY
jgi:hypothetical protein